MTAIQADDVLPDNFDEVVLDCLRDHPEGLDEFRLIRHLAALFPDSLFAREGALRDSLLLFQTHFLLFHALYRLSDRLTEKGLELHVHTLSIRLRPRVPGMAALQLTDPLRSYYLDWDQWASTHVEDVERLLGGFVRGAGAVDQTELQAALQRFGLQPPVTRAEIKRRYRQLVSAAHPDRGGDTAVVQELNAALLILQRYYGRP
ncbi:MAG: molecular chaperone DnaJ [Gammaproteobacteria bacterium HGW-Gammaproteobacteria-11]|nr:MAG: molecular chaperone DnaJ [Gammaproteobacteria bacterium HGW-Gammaproteobacteria-11]